MAATEIAISLSWPEVALRIFAALLLVLLNGFFVAAEFALVSVRRTRIDQLVDEGNSAAKSVQRSQTDLNRYLSATQLGITIASLALGWIGEGTVASVLEPFLIQIPALSSPAAVHTVSAGVAFGLITYLHIVLGELAPKSIAILYPEKTALWISRPNEIFFTVFSPLLSVLNWSSNVVLKTIGIRDAVNTHSNPIGPEELQLMIASNATGGLDKDEQELLANVFEFGDAVAIDVMVPRTSIDAIPADCTIREVLAEVAQTGHSRYPLYEDSLDTIRGMIHIKDVVSQLAKGELQFDGPVRPLARAVQFVPENKRISELLTQMQRERQSMVIVVDEFGGTAGLLTMENLIEELVGNIVDEGENVVPDITRLDEKTAIVQAQTDLEDVNERLGLDFPLSDEYKTLGGFLIFQMGQKIPQPGETFLFDGIELTVLEAEGPRLERIQLLRHGTMSNEPSDEESLSGRVPQ